MHCLTVTCVPPCTADPPHIVKLVEPERRHDTCVEFIVRGNPPPELRWLHNGVEIGDNGYIYTDKGDYQDYQEGCLIFINPTHYNNGNYTLEAWNGLGFVSDTIYAHFLHAPFEGE